MQKPGFWPGDLSTSIDNEKQVVGNYYFFFSGYIVCSISEILRRR